MPALHPKTYYAHLREVVGRFLFIDALVTAILLGAWYFGFAGYNRRRGTWALRWVANACAGRARVIEAQWLSSSLLRARLRFSAHWFENACVTVRLLPRAIPTHWALSRWRKQKEVLIFEADLGYAPGFHLDVVRHRWLTRSEKGVLSRSKREWTISRPGPIVLTTRAQWTQELTPLVNSLMTARGHNLLSVRFRPESPHFAASVPLDALSDQEVAAGFLGVLRELAAGASTQQT